MNRVENVAGCPTCAVANAAMLLIMMPRATHRILGVMTTKASESVSPAFSSQALQQHYSRAGANCKLEISIRSILQLHPNPQISELLVKGVKRAGESKGLVLTAANF